MKKLITLTILTLTLTVSGQNKEAILKTITEYTNNYGNSGYSHEYVDTKLNPALLRLEKLTCGGNDFELLDRFLQMLSKTKGSANEVPSDVLAGIFICKPEAVQKYLTQVYKDPYFKNILEFGFGNKTYRKEHEIENYSVLKKRLDNLLRIE
jgi:hypothetical protein